MMGLTVGGWGWWVAGLVFLILEMVLPSFFFMWLATAAAVTGILVWLLPGLSFLWQVIIFSVLAVATLLLGQAYSKKWVTEKTDHPQLNKRGECYVGRVFTLYQAIENGQGKIKVDDTLWKVHGEDCGQGTKVRVIAVSGTVLDVEPIA